MLQAELLLQLLVVWRQPQAHQSGLVAELIWDLAQHLAQQGLEPLPPALALALELQGEQHLAQELLALGQHLAWALEQAEALEQHLAPEQELVPALEQVAELVVELEQLQPHPLLQLPQQHR